MDSLLHISTAFECHSVSGIRACFAAGLDPNSMYNGKPLIHELINMYTRGPGFKECIRVFIENGLVFDDPVLLAVLADDAKSLQKLLESNKDALIKTYTFPCTFTPLLDASLLHIAAEYGHLDAAQVLVNYGAAVNARAGTDAFGFGGQTPIFHTVNQDANKGIAVLRFLIGAGADLDLTLKGLIWGKGYEWETFIPDVNPVSYAMMGLLRQFQRTEAEIYEIVGILHEAKYGQQYIPENVPNRYLKG